MNDMMIMSGPFERFANERDRARKDAQERRIDRTASVRRETIDGVIDQRERDATFKVLARGRGLIERWRFEDAYVDEYLVAFRDRARRARTRRAIHRLARAIREDGAQPVLVISPVLESWDRYHWAPIHAFVERAGAESGFTVLDPLEAWQGDHDPEELRIGGDNLHYSAHGHAVLGAAIAAAIEGRGGGE
jgi:hypothetical protein